MKNYQKKIDNFITYNRDGRISKLRKELPLEEDGGGVIEIIVVLIACLFLMLGIIL